VLEAARGDGLFESDGDMRTALEEVCERNDENAELAEVFSRIHGDLMEGFSSLVSMNLNALVRTLTEITIALAVPAIIVGLWGMNVPTPFAGSRTGFAVLTVLVVALTVVTFLAIRYAERIGPRPGRRS
jgi:magnesium transporter